MNAYIGAASDSGPAASAAADSAFIKVGKAADIPPGSVKIIAVAGRLIAFCNVGGALFAVEDRCSHDDGPLGEGALDGFAIECPRHGARFDVRTGEVLCLPAPVPVKTFPVKVEDGDLYVQAG